MPHLNAIKTIVIHHALLACTAVLFALAASGCGGTLIEGEGSESDIQLFSSLTSKKGSTQKACEELDKLCKNKGYGCSAHTQFCAGTGSKKKGSGSAASTICKRLSAACGSSSHPACAKLKTYCPAKKTGKKGADAGIGSKGSDGGTGSKGSKGSDAGTGGKGTGTSKADAGKSSSTSLSGCCSAARGCIAGKGCSAVASQCVPTVKKYASTIYWKVCNSYMVAKSTTCCTKLASCSKDSGVCGAALKSCVALVQGTKLSQKVLSTLMYKINAYCPKP